MNAATTTTTTDGRASCRGHVAEAVIAVMVVIHGAFSIAGSLVPIAPFVEPNGNLQLPELDALSRHGEKVVCLNAMVIVHRQLEVVVHNVDGLGFKHVCILLLRMLHRAPVVSLQLAPRMPLRLWRQRVSNDGGTAVPFTIITVATPTPISGIASLCTRAGLPHVRGDIKRL